MKEAKEIIDALVADGLRMSLAESCTGGMVAAAITEVPGASRCFDRSYVCYSAEAKREMLGIPSGVIDEFGAVSGEVAAAMAEHALQRAGTDIACSVSGVAGPGPDEEGNPPGRVFIACAASGRMTRIREFSLQGGRNQVRAAAVAAALLMIGEMLGKEDLHEENLD